jgi:adenylyltransferase/sulfurtransferase
VDFSNLQRQIIHRTASVGQPKVVSAQAALRDINPKSSALLAGARR